MPNLITHVQHHLYFSGSWLDVSKTKKDIKKTCVVQCAQNVLTILGQFIKLYIEWSFNNKVNLHFDNGDNNHMRSIKYEDSNAYVVWGG